MKKGGPGRAVSALLLTKRLLYGMFSLRPCEPGATYLGPVISRLRQAGSPEEGRLCIEVAKGCRKLYVLETKKQIS